MEKESGDKLMEEINRLSSDHEYVELYTKLSKKELEYNTYIEEAKQEGFNDGFNNGFFKGEKNRNIEIARSMLNKNMDIKLIRELTNLTIDEINCLK